jgi:hypothetical protein
LRNILRAFWIVTNAMSSFPFHGFRHKRQDLAVWLGRTTCRFDHEASRPKGP